MKILSSLLLLLPFFYAVFASANTETFPEDDFHEFCYEDKKCHDSSLEVLENYKKGNKIDLNFSQRYYTGFCDNYSTSNFEFGSTINLYFKKEEQNYYMNIYFGYVPKDFDTNDEEDKSLIHSPESIENHLTKFKFDEINKIHEEKNFHYKYIKRSPTTIPFFSWMRSNPENDKLFLYGFFAWGSFICEAQLIKNTP